MAFRDLVMGGAGCAVPGQDGSSSSNPLGGLADSIIGSASKTQERIRELPGLAGPGQSGAQLGRNGPLTSLPGSEINLGRWPEGQMPDYLRGFQGADLREFIDTRNQSVERWPPQLPSTHPNQEGALFAEFEGIYGQQPGPTSAPHLLDAPPQRVLNGFLHSFLDSSRTNAPFPAIRLPELGLSQADKRRIRDRSHIMGRHIFADKGEAFIDSQVNGLLHSLDIDDSVGAQTRGPLSGQLPEFEQLWKEGYAQSNMQVVPRPPMPLANQWADEFQNQVGNPGVPQGWAEEFEIQRNGDHWVNQFQERQNQSRLPIGPMGNVAGMEQTRSLVQTLSQNQDPKFQNSKFLQFVSKMSRGELIVEDNQVKPTTAKAGADTWANEFEEQHPASWASEFTGGEHQLRSDTWANEFARGAPDAWVDEFSRLGVKDWADEFGDQNVKGLLGDETSSEWVDSYDQYVILKEFHQTTLSVHGQFQHGTPSLSLVDVGCPSPSPSYAGPVEFEVHVFRVNLVHKLHLHSIPMMKRSASGLLKICVLYIACAHAVQNNFSVLVTRLMTSFSKRFVEEQVRGEMKRAGSSRFVYQFADNNPYVGHPNPLKEGQDLFRRGLLSEAVLALEAEVLKNPDNAEGWRLLGITHAENDDDRQAIASMVRARDADPSNLEVLLALGVSHTNELEQEEALRYLRGWLQHHPKYGTLVPGDVATGLNPSEVESLFQEAAQLSPEDSDVHTVLGVLYNLSRNYDKAISSFERALQLKPRDYSLWNKLGATQANSSRSAEAIYAYQEALDLKPNYVRAWSNMGIGYANQGRYEESVQYYVRALVMNPKADNAWQYLRISLSIASRNDLLDACERRDLEALQKEFPL